MKLRMITVCVAVLGVGCGRESGTAKKEGSAPGQMQPTVAARPVPRRPPRPRFRPDSNTVCPAALPKAWVDVADVEQGVVVTITTKGEAERDRIRRLARYLGKASVSSGPPEKALSEAERARCAVVLRDTKLKVRDTPGGARIFVTAVNKEGVAPLRALARKRLAKAYPLPKVEQWKCGSAKAPATWPLPHQAHHLFRSAPQERLVPTGWDSGDTTISNEARLELFLGAAKDLGGGYVGVGSTQNFVLAAWANSDWVWLMDFTRIVVDANRVHIAFLKESTTPEAFQGLWQVAQKAEGLKVIDKHYGKDPGLKKIRHAYVTAQKFVVKRFGKLAGWVKKYRFETWLSDLKLYQRIRRLALAGRIRAVRGDLNGHTTLCAIGEAARRMGVVIRILYPSNAEEYKVFRPYRWPFRRNVRNLPSDEKSLVLRTYTYSPTRLPWPTGWKGVSKVGFHYNAQPLRSFQNLLRLPNQDVKKIMMGARDPDRDGFSRHGK